MIVVMHDGTCMKLDTAAFTRMKQIILLAADIIYDMPVKMSAQLTVYKTDA